MDSTASREPETTNGAVTSRDRFLGCLLGGAVGDALGAAVEFQSRAAILETFGPDGITDYAPIYGGHGAIREKLPLHSPGIRLYDLIDSQVFPSARHRKREVVVPTPLPFLM